MTTTEQKLVLEEYVSWQERRATEAPDLTTTAFLAERDAEDALIRVTNATLLIERAEASIPDSADVATVEKFRETLEGIRDALQGDLDYIEEKTLGSLTIRRIPV